MQRSEIQSGKGSAHAPGEVDGSLPFAIGRRIFVEFARCILDRGGNIFFCIEQQIERNLLL